MNVVIRRPRKRKSQLALRRNVCLPNALDEQIPVLLLKFRMGTFSDYVQAHMRQDLGIIMPPLAQT